MLLMSLLVPDSMIGFGRRFLRRPPERINAVFGYRSARSMQNEDTWRFAHAHCGALWQKLGWTPLALSAAAMAFVYNAPSAGSGCSAVASAYYNAPSCSSPSSLPNAR